jgi:hypothetical protein
MNKMIWNNDTQSYRGTCADGSIVDVTGDEWSESVADGVHAICDNQGLDRHDITDEQHDQFVDETEKELDDPEMWASIAYDNPNVEIIEA